MSMILFKQTFVNCAIWPCVHSKSLPSALYELPLIIIKSITTFIFLFQFAIPFPLPFFKITFINISIFPYEFSLSFKIIVNKVALINVTISIYYFTSTCDGPINEVPLIDTTIFVTLDSVPILFAILPIPLVNCFYGFVTYPFPDSSTTPFAFLELALVCEFVRIQYKPYSLLDCFRAGWNFYFSIIQLAGIKPKNITFWP